MPLLHTRSSIGNTVCVPLQIIMGIDVDCLQASLFPNYPPFLVDVPSLENNVQEEVSLHHMEGEEGTTREDSRPSKKATKQNCR